MRDRRSSKTFFLIPPAILYVFWIFMALNILLPALLLIYMKMNNNLFEMHIVIWYLKVPLVLYVMAYLTMSSYVALRRARQTRQNERVNALALDDLSDFCLYLRAFRSAGRVKLPYLAPQGRYFFFLGPVTDAELIVSLQAHHVGMTVVALGDTVTGYGASKINTSEENWIETYQRLADGARFIVMAPFDRPSTLFETKNIFRTPERLRKTLFVMPPRLRFSPLSPRTWIQENFEARWKKTKNYLAKDGIALPSYDRKGCFFAYEPDTGMEVEQAIIGSKAKAIEQLFKALSKDGNAARVIIAANLSTVSNFETG